MQECQEIGSEAERLALWLTKRAGAALNTTTFQVILSGAGYFFQMASLKPWFASTISSSQHTTPTNYAKLKSHSQREEGN